MRNKIDNYNKIIIINMESLPIEVQTKILNVNPNILQIASRFSNLYTQQQFVANHCYVPIKEEEIKDYVNLYVPQQFIIYYEITNYHFVVECYILNKYCYNVLKYDLQLDDLEINESYFYRKFRCNNISIHEFNNLFLYDCYYDDVTTFQILKLRNCDQYIKNYSQDYALKLHSNLILKTDIKDLDSFYKELKRIMYISYFNINNFHNRFLEVVTFNYNDQINDINTAKKCIQKLENFINNK